MPNDYIEGIREAVRILDNCSRGDGSDLPVNPDSLNDLALKILKRQDRKAITEAVARAWCYVETDEKIMYAALVEAIVDEVMKL